MSRFRKIMFIIIIIEALLIIVSNLLYIAKVSDETERLYRVEAKRVTEELKEKQILDIDLSKYKMIKKISKFESNQKCNNDYLVEEVDGVLYRIEYSVQRHDNALIYMNIGMISMFLLTLFVIIYVSKKILGPFHNMSNLSLELAKGNLSVPIKEEKNKFFGRFIWGMDMLRETLEDNKQKELDNQKEKKTLILSLSHDIKTPLSAIELYTKALSENLYHSEEKKLEMLQGISKNTNEIKKYVNEIVTASREDFMNLEVKVGEFYLSDIMNSVEIYYREKLLVIHTELVMEKLPDCLIRVDKDRLIEVLQNIFENAIKYGDGKCINVSYDEEEDCKLITIENTGCNLTKEEMPNIFDSFYRGSNSKNIKGSGLGLYISKSLMKKMYGEIYANIEENKFRITVVVKKAC